MAHSSPEVSVSDKPQAPLLVEIRQALRCTNEELAGHAGVSRRTVQRWWAHGALLPSMYASGLAEAVHPIDRDLAARVAAHAGTTLAALGLEAGQPQPSASPPRPARPQALPEQADSVVYAAADALDLAPKTVRPAVAAAFAQAQRLGLTLDALLPLLAPAAEGAKRGK